MSAQIDRLTPGSGLSSLSSFSPSPSWPPADTLSDFPEPNPSPEPLLRQGLLQVGHGCVIPLHDLPALQLLISSGGPGVAARHRRPLEETRH